MAWERVTKVTLIFSFLRSDAVSAATTDDDDALFQVRHFAQGLQIARAPQVKDVAQRCPCDFGTTGPAARGEQCISKFHRLPRPQHRRALLQAELRHERVQPQIDLQAAKPRLIVCQEFFHRRLLRPQNARQQIRAAHPGMRLGSDQHDASLLVEGANGFGRSNPCGASPDDQIIAANHVEHRK